MSLLGDCVRNLAGLTGLGHSRMRSSIGFVRCRVVPTGGYLAAEEDYRSRKIGSDALLRSARTLKDFEAARETGIRSGDEKLKRLSLRLWGERVEELLPEIDSFEVAAIVLFSLPLGTPAEGVVVERLAELAGSAEDLEWTLRFSALRRHRKAAALAEERIRTMPR